MLWNRCHTPHIHLTYTSHSPQTEGRTEFKENSSASIWLKQNEMLTVSVRSMWPLWYVYGRCQTRPNVLQTLCTSAFQRIMVGVGQKMQKHRFYEPEKQLLRTQFYSVHSLVFEWSGGFCFYWFPAWNARVGIDGEWRKLVYRLSPPMPSNHLEKIEIGKSVFLVFVINPASNKNSW